MLFSIRVSPITLVTTPAVLQHQTAEPLSPHPVPLKAYQKVGADIFTIHGKDYLLVVDYFSKFPEYVHLKSKLADCVIQHLKDISRHGIPETLISDNKPFSSFAMRQFAEEWGFEIIISSPRYPRSNGQVERFVQTVKQLMRKAVESNQDVAIALLQYRNALVAGCEYSPAQLLFNRSLRTRIPTLPITDPDPKRSDLQLRHERQKKKTIGVLVYCLRCSQAMLCVFRMDSRGKLQR